MNTALFKVDPESPDERVLARAAAILAEGGLVAFPTETVYGLGADATSDRAVARIFEAKGRPQDNPLIVHVSTRDAVPRLAREISPIAESLMDRFWPGPLTLVVRKSTVVAGRVSPGLDTVGIRMPAHRVALRLIGLAGVPVAAPSANASGRPSPTTAAHVMQDLGGRIEAVVDGGPCGVGVESTVLDVTVTPPIILRPGGVTKEEIEDVLGAVVVDRGGAVDGRPRSPGMKYRHYAPRARVYVVYSGPQGDAVTAGMRLSERAAQFARDGSRVGILASAETLQSAAGSAGDDEPSGDRVIWLDAGSESDLPAIAAHLFDNLRRFDDLGVDVILAQAFPETGMGLAIMNRLLRASGGRVISDGD
ncbi:MAG: threonylcarbamoyl-AMP synthase [Firmicutes bacterium]|nr:threonylcarbamoyl-AMP synthase [Bacillota bacterium]